MLGLPPHSGSGMPGNAACRGPACSPVVVTSSTVAAATDGAAHPSPGRVAGWHTGRAMAISSFDLFSVGIGPSSSHTVGPMRAAHTFVSGLRDDGLLDRVGRVRGELFGSLGATGHGHGSLKAVLLGLEGEAPESTDPRAADGRVDEVRASGTLRLGGTHDVACDPDADVLLHRRATLPVPQQRDALHRLVLGLARRGRGAASHARVLLRRRRVRPRRGRGRRRARSCPTTPRCATPSRRAASCSPGARSPASR